MVVQCEQSALLAISAPTPPLTPIQLPPRTPSAVSSLADGSFELGELARLQRPQVTHAEWDIDNGTFATTLGVSLSMDPANLLAVMNDAPESWAASTSVYATSQDGTKRDYGTPGLPNDPRLLPAAIADCGLLEEVVTVPVTQLPDVGGWLDIPGWTNRAASSNESPHPLVRGRAILGNGSSDPATWPAGSSADARPMWQGPSASADAYQSDLPATGFGIFSFGFQFSSNGGRTWRSCDTNGDGFDIGFAGKLHCC